MKSFNSCKVVSVSPASLQGYENNYAHYATARVSRGDPAMRPLFLRTAPMQRESGFRRQRKGTSLVDRAAREQDIEAMPAPAPREKPAASQSSARHAGAVARWSTASARGV